MSNKPCVIEFPDERLVSVSTTAAEFAVAYDFATANDPALVENLAPVLHNIKAAMTLMEKLRPTEGAE
jgi:hypothetical protein